MQVSEKEDRKRELTVPLLRFVTDMTDQASGGGVRTTRVSTGVCEKATERDVKRSLNPIKCVKKQNSTWLTGDPKTYVVSLFLVLRERS